jgi:Ribbon-helix-helix protein, copG family
MGEREKRIARFESAIYPGSMTTTLSLDDDLAEVIQQAAAREQRSVPEVINSQLRKSFGWLASRSNNPTKKTPDPEPPSGFTQEIWDSLHPDVKAMIGTVPSQWDAREMYADHIQQKHA